MKKVAIVGSGFVGQATGVALIEKGHEVCFFDIDQEKINSLRDRGYQAFDPGSEELSEKDVFFLTVPTPSMEDGRVDLSFIKDASISLGKKALKMNAGYPIVVVKSTVPPQTTEKIIIPILEEFSGKKAGIDFGVAMVPEYLREVVSFEDARKPRVVVIGTAWDKTYETLESIFKPFACPIVRTTATEAEFQKYIHNCFNAAKISFFNEMRELGDALGLNTEKVFQLTVETAEASWNPRYGTKNLGYFDGSCLPKDTNGLLTWAKDSMAMELKLLEAVVEFNRGYASRFPRKNK
jgi:UDPglucose 6-dehydrogenase